MFLSYIGLLKKLTARFFTSKVFKYSVFTYNMVFELYNVPLFPESDNSHLKRCKTKLTIVLSKKISNDQELIQSDPISCPQNQKGNN